MDTRNIKRCCISNGHKIEAKFNRMQQIKEIFRVNGYMSCPSHQVKEDEMGRACSTNVGEEECI
jgi:hypothetical protein